MLVKHRDSFWKEECSWFVSVRRPLLHVVPHLSFPSFPVISTVPCQVFTARLHSLQKLPDNPSDSYPIVRCQFVFSVCVLQACLRRERVCPAQTRSFTLVIFAAPAMPASTARSQVRELSILMLQPRSGSTKSTDLIRAARV